MSKITDILLNLFVKPQAQPEQPEITRKGDITPGYKSYSEDNSYFLQGNTYTRAMECFRNAYSVYQEINKIALIAAFNPYKFIKRDDSATEEEKTQLELFFEFPNEDDIFPGIIYNTVASLKLTGEAFWEMLKGDTFYQSFYYLFGKTGLKIKDGRIAYYYQDNERLKWNKSEMIYFKIPNPIKFRGISGLESLDMQIAMQLLSAKFNLDSFRKRSQAGDVWFISDGIGKDVAIRVKEAIWQLYEGTNRRGEAIEGGNNVKLDRGKPDALKEDFQDLRQGIEKIISETIGNGESMTGKESEFADIDLYQKEVFPILKFIEYHLNYFILKFMNSHWKIQFKMYSSSMKANARVIQIMRKNGDMSGDEARDLMGLELTGLPEMQEYKPVQTSMLSKLKNESLTNIDPKEIIKEDKKYLKKYLWRGTDRIQKRYDVKIGEQFANLKPKVKEKLNELNLSEITLDTKSEIIDSIPDSLLTISLIDLMKESYLKGTINKQDQLKVGFAFDKVPEHEFKKIKSKATKVSKDTISHFKNGDDTGQMGLSQIISNGMKNHKTVQAISLDVDELFDGWETWKSERIVRAELAAAYNSGIIDFLGENKITEGIEIILGPNPCEECRRDAPLIHTLEDAREFFRDRHPNCMCTPG
jgi:hypothetical protein